MRYPLPKPPDGNSDEAVAIRFLLNWIKSLKPIHQGSSRVSHTTRGVITEVDKEKPSSDTPQAPGMRWRGLWSASEDYSEGDVVWAQAEREISDGSNLNGAFVCIADVSAGGVGPWNPWMPSESSGLPQTGGNDSAHWDMLSPETWTQMFLQWLSVSQGSQSVVIDPAGTAGLATEANAGIVIEDESRRITLGLADVVSSTSVRLRWVNFVTGVNVERYAGTITGITVQTQGAYFLCSDPVIV